MEEITILPIELPEPSFFFSQGIATIRIGEQEISIVLNLQSGDTVFRIGRKQISIPLQDVVSQLAPQLFEAQQQSIDAGATGDKEQ